MVSHDIREALKRTLLDMVSIPSPIGEERALCDWIEQRLRASIPSAECHRHRDSLWIVLNPRQGAPRIGLVGHTDTVRTEHDGAVRIEGDRLYGPGAADMKSGLSVMIELAERMPSDKLGCELHLVFYEKEEGPYEENGLGPLLDQFKELGKLDLAICLEPSDNKLQLGCMGSVHTTLRFVGKTAHSARPWQGENAITKAAPFLAEFAEREPRNCTIDGLIYREVMTPTLAKGGRGRNVVPDVFEVNVNYRFAPGRTPQEVVDEITEWVGTRAEVIAVDLSPAGHPHAEHPLVKRLAQSGIEAVEPKQAWTDVARFDALGVKAVNFGPGTQAQAHQRNEFTELPPLERGYAILERFLSGLDGDAARL